MHCSKTAVVIYTLNTDAVFIMRKFWYSFILFTIFGFGDSPKLSSFSFITVEPVPLSGYLLNEPPLRRPVIKVTIWAFLLLLSNTIKY